MLKYAVQTIKSRNVQYSTGYIKSIIYNIIYIFLAVKCDKIQCKPIRTKRGDGGQKVIGNLEDRSISYVQKFGFPKKISGQQKFEN